MDKLFECVYQIQDGEHRYEFHKLVNAENIEEAQEAFDDYAANYLGSAGEYHNGAWMFKLCSRELRIVGVAETTFAKWLDKQTERAMIGESHDCLICRFTDDCDHNFPDCRFKEGN